MKYLVVILALFLSRCESNRPAIERAAARQIKNKDRCLAIAANLDSVGDFSLDNSGAYCTIFSKDGPVHYRVMLLLESEILPVYDFIQIKQKLHIRSCK